MDELTQVGILLSSVCHLEKYQGVIHALKSQKDLNQDIVTTRLLEESIEGLRADKNDSTTIALRRALE